jgi:hypothetical protein
MYVPNNHISDPITLERGVRQGCSLSPLLYILVLEPFAIKIREDEQISGVKLPGTSKTSKISLYAGDSFGYLHLGPICAACTLLVHAVRTGLGCKT